MKWILSLLLALSGFALRAETNCGTGFFATDFPDPYTGATNWMFGSYCGLVGGTRYRVDHGYDVGEISWGPGLTWDSSVDIDIWWFDEQGAIFLNHAPGTGKITINKAVTSIYPGEYFILRNLDAPPFAPLLLSNGIVPMPKSVALTTAKSTPTMPPLLPAPKRKRYKAIPKGAEMLMIKPKAATKLSGNVRHVDWSALKKLPLQPTTTK